MKTFTFALIFLIPVAAFARQGTLSPGYYICESMEGNTSYFSDIFLGPGDDDAVSKAFTQMLTTKYGYTGRVSCPLAYKTPEGLKRLQDQHKPYAAQRAQQGRKIVETGWTYSGAPSLSPVASPVAEKVPAPTPAASPSADEKALAAQKPASNTASAKPATTPAKPAASAAASPASSEPAKYSYCYAYGSTVGGRQHFYISQPFQMSQGERLDTAFEKYLGPSHPEEELSASCLAPSTLDAAQKGRQTTFDRTSKQTTKFNVIEVDWKR
jgi:hypothetical protein